MAIACPSGMNDSHDCYTHDGAMADSACVRRYDESLSAVQPAVFANQEIRQGLAEFHFLLEMHHA